MTPTHLTCVFCPAQAFPTGGEQWVLITQSVGMTLQRYVCPQKHEFFIELEEENAAVR